MGDYQRDTGSLSLAEHGAYMMMLQHYYATEAPLPVGATLYRLLRAQTKAERGAIDAVVARFWLLKDGALVNTRAVIEIERAVRQRDINREQGKRGGRPGRAVAQIESTTESVFDSHENKTESVIESEPNDNPNHSHSHKEQEQRKEQPPAAPAPLRQSSKLPPIPEWIHADAWAGFVVMRQRERHPLTPRAAQLVIRELDKLRTTGTDPNAVLDQSTRNNWRDVYPLKPTGESHANGSSNRKLSLADQAALAIQERRARAAENDAITLG